MNETVASTARNASGLRRRFYRRTPHFGFNHPLQQPENTFLI